MVPTNENLELLNRNYDAAQLKTFLDLKNELNAVFNFNCIESKSISDNGTKTTYIWKKNNKKVILTDKTSIFSPDSRFLEIFIIDQNLAKFQQDVMKELRPEVKAGSKNKP